MTSLMLSMMAKKRTETKNCQKQQTWKMANLFNNDDHDEKITSKQNLDEI